MLVSFILSQEKKPYNLHSVYDFLSYFRFCRQIFQISVKRGRVAMHRNTSPMVLIPIFPIEFLEILYFAEAFGGLGCHAFGDG